LERANKYPVNLNNIKNTSIARFRRHFYADKNNELSAL